MFSCEWLIWSATSYSKNTNFLEIFSQKRRIETIRLPKMWNGTGTKIQAREWSLVQTMKGDNSKHKGILRESMEFGRTERRFLFFRDTKFQSIFADHYSPGWNYVFRNGAIVNFADFGIYKKTWNTQRYEFLALVRHQNQTSVLQPSMIN